MSYTANDLDGVRLADALPTAKVWGTRRKTLEALLKRNPKATLLNAHFQGGIGPATIAILLAAHAKAAGIAKARAHGILIGLCPCEFVEDNVGAEMAALVDDDCGPHIPGCAFVAEHGEEEVIP
jgi:hypothetical protein